MPQPINVIKNIPVFVSQVKAELVKVSWPSRKDLVGTAGVVVVATILLTAYIGLLDFLLTHVVTLVMK
ncbi:MAG: preprotein translocase subunit SecE [Deltaproteobacteria bacterium]